MSEPTTPDPTGEDNDQVLPPVKQPDDDEPPMEPNPYMGGGRVPA